MAAPAILKIDIIADASKAAGALKQTGTAAQTTSSKFSALGKAVAGGAAVGAVVAFGTKAVKAAQDSAVATARLDAVFKTMGDTTGKASAAAQDYAASLSKKIGVDDDAIMQGQALLATFGKVSDETARQAGIFDRATAAGADMAAAGYGSITTNAVQLGKALNDPIKGVTALGKAGVTFTQQQKDQIKAMVESGDTLGAQKLVLGEVEHQVKGTAAATATSADKMNVAWGETQEAVGNALLPVLEKLAPILTTIAEFIQKNIGWILPLAAVIGVLAVAWNIASVAATLFSVSMWAALWPVLLVIAAIAALVAIGIVIVKNWDTIKAVALTVWNAVLGAVKAVWNWIKANWPLLLAILTGPFGAAVLLIVRNWDTIKRAILAVWDWIVSTWGRLTSILTAPFTAAARVISGVFDSVKRIAGDTLGAVKNFAADVVGFFKDPLNAIIRAWNRIHLDIPKVEVLGKTIFGGGSIGVPQIPELATGGAVMRTGLAIVHAGETFSGVGNSLGGQTVNLTVNVTTTGLGADTPQIQRGVVQALRGYVARNGPVPVPVTGRA